MDLISTAQYLLQEQNLLFYFLANMSNSFRTGGSLLGDFFKTTELARAFEAEDIPGELSLLHLFTFEPGRAPFLRKALASREAILPDVICDKDDVDDSCLGSPNAPELPFVNEVSLAFEFNFSILKF